MFKALRVEPRPDNEMVGDSGLPHQGHAIGLDNTTSGRSRIRRLMFLSCPNHPDSAAVHLVWFRQGFSFRPLPPPVIRRDPDDL